MIILISDYNHVPTRIQARNHAFMHDKQVKKIIDSIVSQLVDLRKQQALSHETVAEKSRLHRSTISLIEARKMQPTIVTLLKIADALGVNLSGIISKAERELRKLDQL